MSQKALSLLGKIKVVLILVSVGLVLAHCNPTPVTSGAGGTGGATPTITPTPGDIGIPVDDDCDILATPAQRAACGAFITNEIQYVLPALEDISGVRFRDCLTQIRFDFNITTITTGQGWAYQDHGVGVVQYNPNLTSIFFNPASPDVPLAFDDHEPLHLLMQCAHVSNNYNGDHVFFFGAQAELDERIYERSGRSLSLATERATLNRQYILDKFNELSGNPALFGAASGQYHGCPGALTYILFADYIRPHHEIVHEWFQAVYHDATLAGLGYSTAAADQRFLQVTTDLMHPTPQMRSFLSPYCTLP